MVRLLYFFALLMTLVFPAVLFAQTDVVYLNNGDRVTGRIRSLDRGILTITRSPMGRVEIEWPNVDKVTSEQRFQVELASGQRYFGTLSTLTAKQLQVQTDTGPTKVEMKDVRRIFPISAGFLGQTTGSLAFGFGLSSPPDVTTSYILDGGLTHRGDTWLTKATLDSLLDRNNGTVVQTRNFLDLDTQRLLPERWFALGTFQLQNDKFLSLNVRLVAGGGLGRTVVHAAQTNLQLFGGLDYNGERYADPFTRNNSPEALAGINWDWFPAGIRADLDTTARTYVSLNQSRVRLEVNSELKDYVFRKFFWSLDVFESFDSNPGGNRKQSDFGTDMTVGWEF